MESFNVNGVQGKMSSMLFTPKKLKSCRLRASPYSYREINPSKVHQSGVRNPSGGWSDSIQMWNRQASLPVPVRGPREPLGHHLSTSSQGKLSLSNPRDSPVLKSQGTGVFTYWATLRWEIHYIYHTERPGTSSLLHTAPLLRIRWGCTQPKLIASLMGTFSLLGTVSITVILCSFPSVVLQSELHCSSQQKFK